MEDPERRINELRDNVAAITHDELEAREDAREAYAEKGKKPKTAAQIQGDRWRQERDEDKELENRW